MSNTRSIICRADAVGFPLGRFGFAAPSETMMSFMPVRVSGA